MKLDFKIIIVFYISIFCSQLLGQLHVDIGSDTIYCRGLYLFDPDTTYIGRNLELSGGTQPYEYTWECEYWAGSTLLHASDFLNDTTIFNPYFIDYPLDQDSVKFHLIVTDGIDETASDSIFVRFSSFTYSLADQKYWINKGDSVQIYSLIHGGIQPLEYSWIPENSLTDPTFEAPWAKPDTTTEYSLNVTDAIGCKSDTVVQALVTVSSVAIDQQKRTFCLMYFMIKQDNA